jgi:hypothetical protein
VTGVARATAMVSGCVVSLAVMAGSAGASAPPTGTVHVVYVANSSVVQNVTVPESGNTSTTEKLSWNVSADVPLAAGSTAPYRYSKNFKGTVNGSGAFTHDGVNGAPGFNCGGALVIAPANQEQAGTFEIDLAKSGGKLTSKATLGASSPVPVYTTDFAQFGPDAGANCAGSPLISNIESGPSPAGPHPVVVKLDLAKLSKAKGKTMTFKVGKKDDVTHGNHETNYDWNGTITLTLTK